MFKSDLYYRLKPFLPWRVRMGLRRLSARWTRSRHSDTWPILPAAAAQPAGWPGWPGGKKFALVLTHDVETPAGLAKCRQVAALETALGFRSSFNFIPEGPYQVPAGLRRWLSDRDFEIGVHDLQHDGHLFTSRADFERKAQRINHYLREWNASGFRAGFMLRKLAWLHHLDIQYDSSTFDTDPFELQPEGSHTIFPSWINSPPGFQRPGGATPSQPTPGYVELPYTLPQDSTLFLVLREPSPEIWLRKLDWIARHGGMALVNVHPDYIRFEGEPPDARTYPVRFYQEFLEYVLGRYGGDYWHPLPRQMAAFTRPLAPRPKPPRGRRIAMVTYSAYETDGRVTRYAEALSERGDVVDVYALRRDPSLPRQENVGGVTVHRLQERFNKAVKSRSGYAWPLLRFLAVAGWALTRQHLRQPYGLVHVHNIPDFLVFAAWLPRVTGAPVILDIHDIVPELYGSRFGGRSGGLTFGLLRQIETWSARFANHVIVSNHLWLEKYARRTGTGHKCAVFINNVDTRLFRTGLRTRTDDRLIVMFPGGLQWHQGLDLALRAFRVVRSRLPAAEFHIYGDGPMKPALIALSQELELEGVVKFFPPVRLAEIAPIMSNASLGVVPKRADSFGNEAYSTKIMEFLSLGVPVVVSRTQIDQFYFDDSVVRFFESGNVDALAEAMLAVLENPELRRTMITRGLVYSQSHGWPSRKGDYLQLVDALADGFRPSHAN